MAVPRTAAAQPLFHEGDIVRMPPASRIRTGLQSELLRYA